MNKTKIIITISAVMIIAICIILLHRNTFFGLDGNDVPEKTKFKKVKLITGGKPEHFTEGVWIKKYPDDYACFKFETANRIKIVCDPGGMNETVTPDIVTESHQDADHIVTSRLKGIYKLFKRPGNYTVKGIKITGIPGQHNKRDRTVTNTIFVFDIDGIKIAHFASQGQIPNDEMRKKLDEFGGIDVLMIQGTTSSLFMNIKMTDGECVAVIDRLKPKIVIPEHGSSRISENFARHYKTKVEYIDIDGLIVTRDILKGIKGPRIINMDTRE